MEAATVMARTSGVRPELARNRWRGRPASARSRRGLWRERRRRAGVGEAGARLAGGEIGGGGVREAGVRFGRRRDSCGRKRIAGEIQTDES